jgi:transposase
VAAAKALPLATQVADRWHLMENASRAFLDAVQKSMRQIQTAIGAATVNPDLLSAAEHIQYEGYLRREDANASIIGLAKDGLSIKEIVRHTGRSRGLIRRILRRRRGSLARCASSPSGRRALTGGPPGLELVAELMAMFQAAGAAGNPASARDQPT